MKAVLLILVVSLAACRDNYPRVLVEKKIVTKQRFGSPIYEYGKFIEVRWIQGVPDTDSVYIDRKVYFDRFKVGDTITF